MIINHSTPLSKLRELCKVNMPDSLERFIKSIQQSLAVEGYIVSDEAVKLALERLKK